MTKSIYYGVGNKARKVKKMYIGVDGRARKVKKAYIGVNGIARLFFSGDAVEYFKTIALNRITNNVTCNSNLNYALFAGGFWDKNNSNAVTTIDKSLTVSSAANLKNSKTEMGTEKIGDYVIFAGGFWQSYNNSSDSNYCVGDVAAYHVSLTQTSPKSLRESKDDIGTASTTNHAIFAGGHVANGWGGVRSYRYTVDAYDKSLTQNTTAANVKNGGNYTGASVGGKALFAGGGDSGVGGITVYDTVECYNASLVKSTIAPLSVARNGIMSANLKNHALFAGGLGWWATYDIIDAYDSNLTRTNVTPMTLGSAVYYSPVVSNGNSALFGIHKNDSTMIDVYDSNLTKTMSFSTKKKHESSSGTALNNYVFIPVHVNYDQGSYNVELETYTLN